MRVTIMDEPLRLVPPPVRLRSGYFSNAGLEDVDPDVITITDYLAGELEDDARARVEDRLSSDAAFADKVRPVMVAWRSGLGKAPSSLRWSARRTSLAIAAAVVIVALPLTARWLTPSSAPGLASSGMWRPELAVAGDSARSVVAPGRVAVTLAPRSRVITDRFRLPRGAVRMALDGSATVVVPVGEHVKVRTGAGEMELRPGRYVITESTDGRDVRIVRQEAGKP